MNEQLRITREPEQWSGHGRYHGVYLRIEVYLSLGFAPHEGDWWTATADAIIPVRVAPYDTPQEALGALLRKVLETYGLTRDEPQIFCAAQGPF